MKHPKNQVVPQTVNNTKTPVPPTPTAEFGKIEITKQDNATKALPLGKYEVTEITAPTGYEVDSTVYTVEITESAFEKSLDIYDVAKPTTPVAPLEPRKPGTTSFTKQQTVPTSPTQPQAPKQTVETETPLLPDTGNTKGDVLGNVFVLLFISILSLGSIFRRNNI